jgi:hypothetical protein
VPIGWLSQRARIDLLGRSAEPRELNARPITRVPEGRRALPPNAACARPGSPDGPARRAPKCPIRAGRALPDRFDLRGQQQAGHGVIGRRSAFPDSTRYMAPEVEAGSWGATREPDRSPYSPDCSRRTRTTRQNNDASARASGAHQAPVCATRSLPRLGSGLPRRRRSPVDYSWKELLRSRDTNPRAQINV